MDPSKINDSLDSLAISVADHVTAMLAYWDKNQVCRFANAAYRDWFGKTREEMVGKITLKALLGPLYEKNLPYITGALEGREQVFEREIITPGGSVRYALANYFPDIAEGEVRGFFVHVADITSIKLLEIECVRSNEIISEQNKRLLNFANIISHNLRSYANNLESIINLFIAAETDKEKNEMLKYLKSISRGFSSTIHHLNEIVAVQNMGKLKIDRINLCDKVKKAIEILSIQIKKANATVLNNAGTNITMLANHAYLESILLNLLSNAIKYRHPDRKPVIEFSTETIGNKLVLKVKDNGIGINLEKYKDDLFGMYKTFHGNADAVGIGLFIVKFQVESMGGHIEVESGVQKGTTFSVYFRSGIESMPISKPEVE